VSLIRVASFEREAAQVAHGSSLEPGHRSLKTEDAFKGAQRQAHSRNHISAEGALRRTNLGTDRSNGSAISNRLDSLQDTCMPG
jgi:hypothetical protein